MEGAAVDGACPVVVGAAVEDAVTVVVDASAETVVSGAVVEGGSVAGVVGLEESGQGVASWAAHGGDTASLLYGAGGGTRLGFQL